jgi:UDP-N-acetylmuramate dehydrogenase
MALRITDDAQLERLNSFGVRARAKTLIELDDVADATQALEQLRQTPSGLILGGGSNVLLAGDIDRVVLRIALRGIRALEIGADCVVVEAAAGEPWHELVQWCLRHRLYGLENLSLIPGLAGAAPVQNIGAYGVELAQRVDAVQAIDIETGQLRKLTAAECAFGYRDSLFKRQNGRWLIVSIRLRLSRIAQPCLDYPSLAEALRAHALPTAEQVAKAVCSLRRQRLPDPAVLGNAGSFFKNPVADAATAAGLLAQHPDMPQYAAGAQRVKLAAAWLIERCGWKGHREGDAGVHAQHALVLVNHGRASGAQILALSRRIQASVHERFGLMLEPEPVIVEH